MKILAVGMLDVATFGTDHFFVQTGPGEAVQCKVHRDGCMLESTKPQPLPMVESAVLKFHAGYLLEDPLEIGELDELPAYLGQFKITSPTYCRYSGPTVTRVSRRDGSAAPPKPVATFTWDGKHVLSEWHDAGYRSDIEERGVPALIDERLVELRPSDGEDFVRVLPVVYWNDAAMVVTVEPHPRGEVRRPAAARPTGNFGGWVCPQCGNTDLVGGHHRFGTRTIDELYCPQCGLSENAHSSEPTYTAVLARWRAPSRLRSV